MKNETIKILVESDNFRLEGIWIDLADGYEEAQIKIREMLKLHKQRCYEIIEIDCSFNVKDLTLEEMCELVETSKEYKYDMGLILFIMCEHFVDAFDASQYIKENYIGQFDPRIDLEDDVNEDLRDYFDCEEEAEDKILRFGNHFLHNRKL